MVAWFSVAPDDGSGSYGKYVGEVLALLDKTGLKYRLGAMGTEIEGPREEVFAAIQKCHQLFVDKPGVRRVGTVVKIDDRIGAGEGEIERKVRSAESRRSQMTG